MMDDRLAKQLAQRDDLLRDYIRVRLIKLLDQDNATAIKAAEMLLGLPVQAQESADLAALSTEKLLEIERRADEYIRRFVDGAGGAEESS